MKCVFSLCRMGVCRYLERGEARARRVFVWHVSIKVAEETHGTRGWMWGDRK